MGKWFTTEDGDGHVRVRVDPALPRDDLGLALVEVKALAQTGTEPLTVDLAGVTRRDHAAIAAILELRRLAGRRHREFAWENGDGELMALLEPLAHAADAEARVPRESAVEQIGERTLRCCRDVLEMVGFVGELTRALAQAVVRPDRVRWRDVWRYMDRCGTDALPITLLICFLMGLILGFQSAVQMHRFGADLYVANLVGLSIVKELGPLMVAIIATGRAGSAFAAEIGTMTVNEEVDALKTMGLDPSRFLVVPKILALTVVMPLLTAFGDAVGIAGGFVVGRVQLGIPLIAYWQRTIEAIRPWDYGEGLVKSVVFGVLVAAVGCLRGLRTDGGAEGVGRSTTSAVVTGIFLVIVADTFLTFLFSRLDTAL